MTTPTPPLPHLSSHSITRSDTTTINFTEKSCATPLYKNKKFWACLALSIILIAIAVLIILNGANIISWATIIPAVTTGSVSIGAGWTMSATAAIGCYIGGGLQTLVGIYFLYKACTAKNTAHQKEGSNEDLLLNFIEDFNFKKSLTAKNTAQKQNFNTAHQKKSSVNITLINKQLNKKSNSQNKSENLLTCKPNNNNCFTVEFATKSADIYKAWNKKSFCKFNVNKTTIDEQLNKEFKDLIEGEKIRECFDEIKINTNSSFMPYGNNNTIWMNDKIAYHISTAYFDMKNLYIGAMHKLTYECGSLKKEQLIQLRLLIAWLAPRIQEITFTLNEAKGYYNQFDKNIDLIPCFNEEPINLWQDVYKLHSLLNTFLDKNTPNTYLHDDNLKDIKNIMLPNGKLLSYSNTIILIKQYMTK